MEYLLHDTIKFKILQDNPTLGNLLTVQNYLNTLCKCDEIKSEKNNLMQPKFAQNWHAHNLPKYIKVIRTPVFFTKN